MPLPYKEVLFTCTQITQILSNYQGNLAFDKFVNLWGSTISIDDILSENMFKKTIASIINRFDNEPIYLFVLDKAKDFYKHDYPQYLLDLNDYIFKEAISSGHLKNIEKYMVNDFNIEESLQISIKYGAWSSFEFLLENHIPKKQKSKIISWSQQQFWQYASNGYAHIDFIEQLVEHPLSINKPIKQPIYTLIKECYFDFLNEFIQNKKRLSIMKDINIEHFYTLLLKQIALHKENTYYKETSMLLLQTSYQLLPVDFSKISKSLGVKFKKDNPEIEKMIEKFILKDKLDLLPQKKLSKNLKI